MRRFSSRFAITIICLADAAHRLQELRPLLNDYRALVIDEAHKLPDAARQMYGQSLSAEDFSELCTLLEKEKYILGCPAAEGKVYCPYGSHVPWRTAGRSPAHRLRFNSGSGSGASGLPFPSSADSKTACSAPSPVDHLPAGNNRASPKPFLYRGSNVHPLHSVRAGTEAPASALPAGKCRNSCAGRCG